MTDHEQKGEREPVEAGPDAMSVNALVETAVHALDGFGEAMTAFITDGGPRTPVAAALKNHQATMALVLRRLGNIARATLEHGDTTSALTLDLVTRVQALESVLCAVLPDDPPGPGATFRLGPAFWKRPGKDGMLLGEVRLAPTEADRPKTSAEIIDEHDREALARLGWTVDEIQERLGALAESGVLRVMGFDGSETTIEIPPFDPLGTMDKPVTPPTFEMGWDGRARREKPKPADLRVVYGARCSWWDSIDHAGSRDGTATGLPCCPHCGSPLFETENEAKWWEGVDAHEAAGHPGYRAMIEWARGKCFPAGRVGVLVAMAAAYQDATGEVLSWVDSTR